MDSEYKDTLRQIASIQPQDIVKIADKQGKYFKEQRIKANQIRNFYGEINAMKLSFQIGRGDEMGKGDENAGKIGLNDATIDTLMRKAILLRPKLAYASGRQPKVRAVYEFMDAAITGIENASGGKEAREMNKQTKKEVEKAFQNFFDLVESVVAYHKFYGDN